MAKLPLFLICDLDVFDEVICDKSLITQGQQFIESMGIKLNLV